MDKRIPVKSQILTRTKEDQQVTCMHNIGHNLFFSPSPSDTCWYGYEDMIAVNSESVKVTGRHYQVSPLTWAEIELKRNLPIKLNMSTT